MPTDDRTLAERLMCAVGLHDYGDPYVMRTSLVVAAERDDEGAWCVEADEDPDPERYVTEVCQRGRCLGHRRRDDLDPDDYAHDGGGA